MCFKAIVLATLALLSLQAHAFSLMPSAANENARWRDGFVRFRVNASGSPVPADELARILNEAFDLWNSVAGSAMRVEVGDPILLPAAALLDQASRETAVVFDEEFSQHYPGSDKSVLAVGSALREGDRYVRGLIVVNGQSGRISAEKLKVILAHEAGHVFGIGHAGDEQALMFPVARSQAKLAEDDVEAITYLYPRKEAINSVPFGCASLAAGSKDDGGQGPGSGAAIFSATFILSWLAFRFRWPQRNPQGRA